MVYTKDDALQFIQENDVKFIKLFFTDIFGSIKSLSIQPSELERAFEKGICFDAAAIGWELEGGKNDLFIVPDPATLCVLPWRPQTGRVVRFFCDIHNTDGTPFTSDPRYMLKKLTSDAFSRGYEIRVGTGCEFYLFKLDENGRVANAGYTPIPQDDAGYCDLAPRDRGENVRREVCLTLEQMGVHPESSRHEAGPGQNEVDFHYAEPLDSADNLSTCKTVVKTVADRYGLYASFAPAPFGSKLPGSGLHINISLMKDGKNLFAGKDLCNDAAHFTAGILAHLPEITVFLNPKRESYERIERNGWEEWGWPVTWAHENRRHVVRVPATDDLHARIEVRSPDSSCNQYLALYLILAAGFDGIEKKTALCAPTDIALPARGTRLVRKSPDSDEYKKNPDSSDAPVLPHTIFDAAKLMKDSDFVTHRLSPAVIKAYRGDSNYDDTNY